MKVPFFDYEEIYKTDYPIYKDSLESVLKRADFILRDDLRDFELNLARYINAKFCIGVGNGTDAIWLALKAAGIDKGDEVILPSHTYVATADAVWAVGATPVLVDIENDHLISPSAIEEAITEKTRAIIPVNLNGKAARLDLISEIAAKKDLVVVEDNAQGLGAKLNGKSAGTFGLASSLSFYPAKILGCLGDGGGVVTNDDNFSEAIRLLRSHGRDSENLVVSWGFNSRLDNLQAAVLDAKLKTLDQDIDTRRKIAETYFHELSEVEELVLPQHNEGSYDHFDSYQNYEIEAENRDELKKYLAERGVGTIIQWGGKAVHEFGLSGVITRDLTNTTRIVSKMLLLPMNQYMPFEHAIYVSETIKDFYSSRSI